MTTPFNPPPEYDPRLADGPGPYRPAPWSKSAIAGFVFSLFGCLGITAVLGLILGIVGVAKTSRGRRQGRGLAIAAIPISLLLGALSVVALLFLSISATLSTLPDRLEAAFLPEAMASGESAAILRELGSSDFNQAVTDADLDAWYAKFTAEHGRLVKILLPENEPFLQKAPGEPLRVLLRGRFVNGVVDIVITTRSESRFGPVRVSNIEVGGISPRAPSPTAEEAPHDGE